MQSQIVVDFQISEPKVIMPHELGNLEDTKISIVDNTSKGMMAGSPW